LWNAGSSEFIERAGCSTEQPHVIPAKSENMEMTACREERRKHLLAFTGFRPQGDQAGLCVLDKVL